MIYCAAYLLEPVSNFFALMKTLCTDVLTMADDEDDALMRGQGVASLEGWSTGCVGWVHSDPAAGERPPL